MHISALPGCYIRGAFGDEVSDIRDAFKQPRISPRYIFLSVGIKKGLCNNYILKIKYFSLKSKV